MVNLSKVRLLGGADKALASFSCFFGAEMGAKRLRKQANGDFNGDQGVRMMRCTRWGFVAKKAE
ncbi:hypothetical protein [Alloprevotella tannerae]|uniref:hypothetical protein n=1 Tax=Alloprevotella tannerae TaxID=76122 RepID=UPI00288B7665|nr:hypothetical protein [Alloprevotella tannerae]